MKPDTVKKFLKLIGYDVQLNALVPTMSANAEADDDDEEEVGETEQEAEGEGEPAVAPVLNAAPAIEQTPPPAANPPPASSNNLEQLDQLITAIGGFEAFKALLLKCAQMADEMHATQANAAAEKKTRAKAAIDKIVANSDLDLAPEQFAKIDVETLEALGSLVTKNSANSAARQEVDFSGLGILINKSGGALQKNASTQLKRPSVLIRSGQ